MGQKRAIKVLTPNRPLLAGKTEVVEVHLRIPDAVHVSSVVSTFEGRCRASFSGHDAVHPLAAQPLHLPLENILMPCKKGVLVLPPGEFRLPLVVPIPESIPGTFKAKNGAIAYRIVIKMTVRRVSSSDEAVLEADQEVDVIGIVECEPRHALPISIERKVSKKIFCFNRLDASVQFELDRSAFIVGEHILVEGCVENKHTSNVLKHVSIELRQKIEYSSGETKKKDHRLISRLICGNVAPQSKLSLHHSLHVPRNCYPSLDRQTNPIQVSYEILVLSSGNFEIEAPIFIGNKTGASARRSILYSDSSSEKNSSIYYCIPPTEGSTTSTIKDNPPPYSSTTHSTKSSHSPNATPVFIPIHVLKTPHHDRLFMPTFGFHGRPGGPQSGPMGFHHPAHFGHPYGQYPPKYRPESPRFLKIEEIED